MPNLENMTQFIYLKQPSKRVNTTLHKATPKETLFLITACVKDIGHLNFFFLDFSDFLHSICTIFHQNFKIFQNFLSTRITNLKNNITNPSTVNFRWKMRKIPIQKVFVLKFSWEKNIKIKPNATLDFF